MKRSWAWPLVVILLLVASSYGGYWLLRPAPLPDGFVYGNGHIEGTEVRLASEIGGRVIEHALVEGQIVRRGQTLVVIDATTPRDQLSGAASDVDSLKRSLATVDAQIDTARHHLTTAQVQARRVETLVGGQVMSQQSLDPAHDAVRQAQGELERLRAQRSALEAQIQSAESRVREAQTQVQRTEVKSPEDGTVLVRSVETGEIVAAGQPLAVLVNLSQLELKVYLPEADVNKLQLGASARVRVDGLPDQTFDARVARIDAYAQFTPRDIHVPDERTQMVYGVTLALGNPDGRLKPGMPADAWIRWNASQPWPARLVPPRD